MAFRSVLCLLLLLIEFNSVAWGQSSYIDIKRDLDQGKNIEEKLSELSELGKKFDENSLKYSNLGLNYARKHKRIEWQVLFLLNKSKYELDLNEITNSLTDAFEALLIIQDHPAAEKHKGRAHYILANGLQTIGSINEAIVHRKLQLAWVLSFSPDQRIANIRQEIGNLFLKGHEADSAIYYYQQAIDYSRTHHNQSMIALNENNLGLCYLEKGELDDALIHLALALEYYEKRDGPENLLMQAIVKVNLTLCYSINDQEELIEQYLKDAISTSRSIDDHFYMGRAYYRMANFCGEKHEYRTAIDFLDSASIAFSGIVDLDPINLLDLYRSYGAYYSELNNYVQVVDYNKKYVALNDSFYGNERIEELSESKSTYLSLGIQNELKLKKTLNEQNRIKIESLKNEAQVSNLKIVLISLVGVLLLVFALFIIFRLRRKNEIKQLNNELLTNQMEHKSHRLTEATLSLTRKKDFAEGLNDLLVKMEGVGKDQISPIKLYIDNELQIDGTILEMEKYILELNSDFFVKIRTQFPHLNDNDIRLCSLIRLNLTSKQIAIIKVITPESVKIAKNRLSKKLHLPPGTILYDFLKDL